MPGAAFLQAEGSTNDHDLGLFAIGEPGGRLTAGRATVGLYHLAWEVDTLAELQRIAAVLTERGALVGASDHGTTKALYAQDPDGLEFEVSWLVPGGPARPRTRRSPTPAARPRRGRSRATAPTPAVASACRYRRAVNLRRGRTAWPDVSPARHAR